MPMQNNEVFNITSDYPSPQPLMVRFMDAEKIVRKPHRLKRAERIAIIYRGMPGAGKTESAQLLKRIETSESGQDNVKIISLYDFYKSKKESNASFFEKYDGSHKELMKVFQNEVEKKLYNFIIIVGIFDKERRIYDIATRAMSNNYDCFVVEMPHNYNDSNTSDSDVKFSKYELDKLYQGWELTPPALIRLEVDGLRE
ncbi:MAG: hypothetical protein MHPSP_002068 [Paramarteilia canceri]